ADTDLLNPITERILDPLQQSFAFFQRLVALLFESLILERSKLQIAAGSILEALAFEVIELTHDPLVDALAQQQHFDAAFLQLLDIRARAGRGHALGDEIVDSLLTRFHALN